jgi:hypothetical protein
MKTPTANQIINQKKFTSHTASTRSTGLVSQKRAFNVFTSDANKMFNMCFPFQNRTTQR